MHPWATFQLARERQLRLLEEAAGRRLRRTGRATRFWSSCRDLVSWVVDRPKAGIDGDVDTGDSERRSGVVIEVDYPPTEALRDGGGGTVICDLTAGNPRPRSAPDRTLTGP